MPGETAGPTRGRGRCLGWQDLGLGRQEGADQGVWTLHTPFPATPPALPLRTRRGGSQPHGPACAGHGGGHSVGLFVLRLVFLVWSLGAQAGLGAWEPAGVGNGRGGGPGRGVAEERHRAWVQGHPWTLPHCHLPVRICPHLLTGGRAPSGATGVTLALTGSGHGGRGMAQPHPLSQSGDTVQVL